LGGNKIADNLIGAPFNMALSTLESIRKLIDDISRISLGFSEGGGKIDEGVIQHVKYKMVKQLTIIAAPLLKPEQNKAIRKELDKINLEKMPNALKFIEKFSPLVEHQLDDLNIFIQVELQKEKYFMPPKSDPRVGWKQA